MLEYIGAIKGIIDVFKGVNDLGHSANANERIFGEIITPIFGNMSKITGDYIKIFGNLEAALKSGKDTKASAKAIDEFKMERMVFLPLRREIIARCDVALGDTKLNKFHHFFQLTKGTFVCTGLGPQEDEYELGGDTPSNMFAAALDRHFGLDSHFTKYAASLLASASKEIEQNWTRLSREFARLELDQKRKFK